ncbi:hypothetical protein IFR05_002926 [Cadophora sp. M221]|nr:hypothetical protein IFR05_002926 [Cadophora sp. M221]
MLYVYTLFWLLLATKIQAQVNLDPPITYWIDTSCAGHVDETTFDEVRLMAAEGNRLLAAGDEIFSTAFQKVFRTGINNVEAVTKVKQAFNKIETIKPSSGATDIAFKQSDIRIYCDNDNRWELIPDKIGGRKVGGKKPIKNSKKPAEEQAWWDPMNFIYRPTGSYGCQDREGQTLAQTYKTKDEGLSDLGLKAGHVARREVITVCNYVLDSEDPILLSGFTVSKDLTGMLKGTPKNQVLNMQDLSELVSLTIFHELCHTTDILNIPGHKSEILGWTGEQGIMTSQLDLAGLLNEADSFALLGLSAVLNRRNIRLSKEDEAATLGKLEFINPPTETTNHIRIRQMRFTA